MSLELTELPLSLFRGLQGETRTEVVVSAKLRNFFDRNTEKRGPHLLWKRTRKDRNALYEGVQFSTRRLAWLVHRGTPIPDNRNVAVSCPEEECLLHLELVPGTGRKYGGGREASNSEVVGMRKSKRLKTRTPGVGTPLRPRSSIAPAPPPPPPAEIPPMAKSPTLRELASAAEHRRLVKASESLSRVRQPEKSYPPPSVTDIAVKTAQRFNEAMDEDTILSFIERTSTPEPTRSNGQHAAPAPVVLPPPVELVPNEAEQARLEQSILDKIAHRLRPIVHDLVMEMKADLWVELASDMENTVKRTLAAVVTGAALPTPAPVAESAPTPAQPVRESRTFTVAEAVEDLALTHGGMFLDSDPIGRHLLIWNPRVKKFFVGKVSRDAKPKFLVLYTVDDYKAKRGPSQIAEWDMKRAKERGEKHEYASRFVVA